MNYKKKLEDISVKIQKETGIKIIGKILDGIPSVGICQFAFDEKISLIVMGTHGTSGLREFFYWFRSLQGCKKCHLSCINSTGELG
ncbi:MAG: universal stress protein [Chloroflexia bacterium]|nr:universal stress protein [Chloroflexia bacterium]